MGGIAHGIGAALFEEFAYNDDGQLIAQTFMDYLLPSSHEVPAVEIIASRDAVTAYRAWTEGLWRSPAISARRQRSPMRSTTRSGRSVFPSTRLPLNMSKLGDLIAAAHASKGN